LHVAVLNYWYDSKMASPEDLLETYSTTIGWVEALYAEGAEVTFLQRFHRHAKFRRNGVAFVLHADLYGPRLRKWQIPCSFHGAVGRVCAQTASKAEPTAVHFNGLLFPIHLRALRAILPRRSPIVVQHHAEGPWRGLRRRVQRWGLRAVDGFFFAASGLASPWADDELILDNQPVYQVMEGSTSFRRKDRAAARAKTGVIGDDPIVLWVGQLISNNDPLTVLRGFELALCRAPNARLYMIYGKDNLLPEVRARIASSPSLGRSVTLLGSVPHAEMESYYNSADYSLGPLAKRRRDALWLPWGVDWRLFDGAVERTLGPPWRLVHVASINWVKDQATLLHAVRLARDRGLAVELDCIGEDVLDGSVERMAIELGLGQTVRFHGFLRAGEIAPFYHQAHLYVHSSLHKCR
jgi:glycosyltransferase involved in cell wall biosynthesis